MSILRGRLLNAREAAGYLGISVVRMRRLIVAAEIDVVRSRTGRFEGVYACALDEWVERRTVRARVPAAARGRSVDAAMSKLMPPTRRYA